MCPKREGSREMSVFKFSEFHLELGIDGTWQFDFELFDHHEGHYLCSDLTAQKRVTSKQKHVWLDSMIDACTLVISSPKVKLFLFSTCTCTRLWLLWADLVHYQNFRASETLFSAIMSWDIYPKNRPQISVKRQLFFGSYESYFRGPVNLTWFVWLNRSRGGLPPPASYG